MDTKPIALKHIVGGDTIGGRLRTLRMEHELSVKALSFEIDFTEQVEVRADERMQWDETTCESVNNEKGEVVLFTDVDKVAVCKFNIRTPVGATWTASLIPLTASAMDAFSIVEDSKYGDVGTDEWQYLKIKIIFCWVGRAKLR